MVHGGGRTNTPAMSFGSDKPFAVFCSHYALRLMSGHDKAGSYLLSCKAVVEVSRIRQDRQGSVAGHLGHSR